MEFEWDPEKALANLRKHGVSFKSAISVFLDEHRIERLDDSIGYDEYRFVTVGLVEEFELAVVYTPRKDKLRIISARRADRYEREAYWNRDLSS